MNLKKRSFTLSGQRTSGALEQGVWGVSDASALARGKGLAALVAAIDGARGERPLASALRLHALAAKGGAA